MEGVGLRGGASGLGTLNVGPGLLKGLLGDLRLSLVGFRVWGLVLWV